MTLATPWGQTPATPWVGSDPGDPVGGVRPRRPRGWGQTPTLSAVGLTPPGARWVRPGLRPRPLMRS